MDALFAYKIPSGCEPPSWFSKELAQINSLWVKRLAEGESESEIRRYLGEGGNPNITDDFGATCLHRAIATCYEKKAKSMNRDDDPVAPLFGHLERLLNLGANINAVSRVGLLLFGLINTCLGVPSERAIIIHFKRP